MFFASPVYAQVRPWGKCVVDGIPTLQCLEVVFSNIVYIASNLIVFLLFVMFVIGAFQYLTSLGNPEKIKKAQGTLRYAVIGFVLYISTFVILKVIDVLFLGGKNTIFLLDLSGN